MNTKNIPPESIILIPVPKDFKFGSYKAAISYKDIIDSNLSIKETNRKIKERLEESRLAKQPNSLLYDFYLKNPEANIFVIDIDNVNITEKRLKFICERNIDFDLHWNNFKINFLNKTFTVRTPRGFHHYFRASNLPDLRAVKCIDASKYLSKEHTSSFKKVFGLKKPVVDVDFIATGVVVAPGNVSFNMLKKAEIFKRREYKILADVPLLEIDLNNSSFKYFFEAAINGKTERGVKQIEKGKKRTTVSKGRSRYDFYPILKSIDLVENCSPETEDSELKSISKELLAQKKEIQKYKEWNQALEKNPNEYSEGIHIKKNEILSSQEIIFEGMKKKLLKEIYTSDPDREYIYNILYKNQLASDYLNWEKRLYPSQFDRIRTLPVGQRSEMEMAFIINLKVRNFEDFFIYFLIQRDFPKTSKCIENPEFIEQAIEKAMIIRSIPESLSYKGIWNDIIFAYSLVRKINFEKAIPKSGGKIRTLIETLYNEASINNSFEIRYSQKALSIGGLASISSKTVKKYFDILEAKDFFNEVVWFVDGVGEKKYPTNIKLKNKVEIMKLPWVVYMNSERLIPQDSNQNIAFIPGVKGRGMEIINYIRAAGGKILKKELYKKFESINDYRRVIRKNLDKLAKLNIIVRSEYIELTDASFNAIYKEYAENYNTHLPEGKKRLKPIDPSLNRKDQYEKERLFMKRKYN